MACEGKATEKVIYPLKPLTTGNQKTFKFSSKWSFHVPLKKWQVKCLILFIYCLCAGSVCFMTQWNHWFWYREGRVFASPHTWALISTAGPWLTKKHLRRYLPSILMSAGTNQWYPLHNPLCSGFHHLLAWTHWRILAALGVLAAGEINLLLGENHWSTGIYRELQRPNRADLHLAVVLSGF